MPVIKTYKCIKIDNVYLKNIALSNTWQLVNDDSFPTPYNPEYIMYSLSLLKEINLAKIMFDILTVKNNIIVDFELQNKQTCAISIDMDYLYYLLFNKYRVGEFYFNPIDSLVGDFSSSIDFIYTDLSAIVKQTGSIDTSEIKDILIDYIVIILEKILVEIFTNLDNNSDSVLLHFSSNNIITFMFKEN